jgi:hypothetical protein
MFKENIHGSENNVHMVQRKSTCSKKCSQVRNTGYKKFVGLKKCSWVFKKIQGFGNIYFILSSKNKNERKEQNEKKKTKI